MKYENLEKAITVCNKITKLRQMIIDLGNFNVQVKIVTTSGYSINTISIDNSCEHDKKAIAQEFLKLLIADYKNDLWKLETQLEEL